MKQYMGGSGWGSLLPDPGQFKSLLHRSPHPQSGPPGLSRKNRNIRKQSWPLALGFDLWLSQGVSPINTCR